MSTESFDTELKEKDNKHPEPKRSLSARKIDGIKDSKTKIPPRMACTPREHSSEGLFTGSHTSTSREGLFGSFGKRKGVKNSKSPKTNSSNNSPSSSEIHNPVDFKKMHRRQYSHEFHTASDGSNPSSPIVLSASSSPSSSTNSPRVNEKKVKPVYSQAPSRWGAGFPSPRNNEKKNSDSAQGDTSPPLRSSASNSPDVNLLSNSFRSFSVTTSPSLSSLSSSTSSLSNSSPVSNSTPTPNSRTNSGFFNIKNSIISSIPSPRRGKKKKL